MDPALNPLAPLGLCASFAGAAELACVPSPLQSHPSALGHVLTRRDHPGRVGQTVVRHVAHHDRAGLRDCRGPTAPAGRPTVGPTAAGPTAAAFHLGHATRAECARFAVRDCRRGRSAMGPVPGTAGDLRQGSLARAAAPWRHHRHRPYPGVRPAPAAAEATGRRHHGLDHGRAGACDRHCHPGHDRAHA